MNVQNVLAFLESKLDFQKSNWEFRSFGHDWFQTSHSDAASGLARWALAHPESPPGIWKFSSPYSNQGADYAHQITACPPGFENLAASLQDICQNLSWLYFCFTKIAKHLWFLKKIKLNGLSQVVTTIIPFKNIENMSRRKKSYKKRRERVYDLFGAILFSHQSGWKLSTVSA